MFFIGASPDFFIAIAPLRFHLPGGRIFRWRHPERGGRAGGLPCG